VSPLANFFKDMTLPTMPAVAHELIDSLREDEVPIGHLRDAIERDPLLAVQLLRLANSARYGVPKSISNIDDAIALLGTSQVRAMALAAFFNDAFPIPSGLDRETFWRDSETCGGMAKWLASGVGSNGQEAWLTGFMVRLGELLMGMSVPGCVNEFEKAPQHPLKRWDREMQRLGFTEGQASAELARRWNFPDVMVNALAAVSNPLAAQPFSKLGTVLHVAELLGSMSSDKAPSLEELPQELLTAIQLDREWVMDRWPEARKAAHATTLH
jgi:HD-like signal output (HDOD) protein